MTNKALVESIDQLADRLRANSTRKERAVSRLFWNYQRHLGKRLLIVTGSIIGYFAAITGMAIFILKTFGPK